MDTSRFHKTTTDRRSELRNKAGLENLREITVTASDLATLGFCEMAVVLSAAYPGEAAHPDLASRRRDGTQLHARRARELKANGACVGPSVAPGD